jgi:hypothetical protein
MPKFMDFHDGLKLSSADIEQLRSQTQAGTTDEYGVRQLELYYNDAGKVYCLLEGPDEDAVRRHHAALDVPCGEVNRVETLLWSQAVAGCAARSATSSVAILAAVAAPESARGVVMLVFGEPVGSSTAATQTR